jgi:hypothetical protein
MTEGPAGSLTQGPVLAIAIRSHFVERTLVSVVGRSDIIAHLRMGSNPVTDA